jgi:hypothetical protein
MSQTDHPLCRQLTFAMVNVCAQSRAWCSRYDVDRLDPHVETDETNQPPRFLTCQRGDARGLLKNPSWLGKEPGEAASRLQPGQGFRWPPPAAHEGRSRRRDFPAGRSAGLVPAGLGRRHGRRRWLDGLSPAHRVAKVQLLTPVGSWPLMVLF